MHRDGIAAISEADGLSVRGNLDQGLSAMAWRSPASGPIGQNG